ncbi:MAG: FtsW/RodA/SpoVE family cell cycle protein, partial [Patescibacteria group bacterium]
MFRSVDPVLLGTVIFLVIGGVFVFLSASLGLFAQGKTEFSQVATNQILLGLGGGFLALLVGLSVQYRVWRRFAFVLFGAALLFTLAVFIPGLGMTANGARRWLDFGFATVQPAEFLKIAYILAVATWFSAMKNRVAEFRYGLLPFLIATGAVGTVLLLQPDTDTFFVIVVSGFAMFFASGARLRDVAVILLICAIGLGVLVSQRPYLARRVTTFLDPSSDSQGASYQIQQSLMAIGAGELT